MNIAEELREQSITAHGVADAGLAVQLNQHDGGHADQSAEIDDERQPVQAGFEDHAGHGGVDVLRELLIRHHAGHDERHDDVQHGGQRERDEDAARQGLVRIDGFFGGRRHRIEADEAEEHDGRGRHDAVRLRGTRLERVDAVRGERLPVAGIDVPYGAHDEQHDDRQLDQHHDVVGLLRLIDADRQHPRDDEHDDETGQIEIRGHAFGGAVRGGQLDRQMKSEAFQQLVEIAGPSRGDGGGLQRVFQNKIPADHEGDQLAERKIRVGVCGTGHRGHRGELRIAQTGETAADGGQQEGNAQCRSGGQRALSGKYEDAGADDGADTKHGKVKRLQRSFQWSRLGYKLLHGFFTKQIHGH